MITFTAFAANTVASNHENGMKAIPVETYACKYNEGKGAIFHWYPAFGGAAGFSGFFKRNTLISDICSFVRN